MSPSVGTRPGLAKNKVSAATEPSDQGTHTLLLLDNGSHQTVPSRCVERCTAPATGSRGTRNSHSITVEIDYRSPLRPRLHAGDDTKLGNLLERRGFESLTQLLKAYRGNLTYHACKRRIYLSFHIEDLPQVRGFRCAAARRPL